MGTEIPIHEFSCTRRIAYDDDHERGLYKSWNQLEQKFEYMWTRCQYAHTKRVAMKQEHMEGCEGYGVGGASMLGRLVKCVCPLLLTDPQPIVLFDPKDKKY